MPRKGKKKKEGKNWRFAYDLYCKEIISSNNPNAGGAHNQTTNLNSNRSTDKNASAHVSRTSGG